MSFETRHIRSIRYANRLSAAFFAGVVLIAAGCDSSETKSEDDTERFVGTWDAVSLTAGPINVLGDLDLVATFRTNRSVQIVVSDNTGELANVSGQYVVGTPAQKVTLSGDDFDEDLEMSYKFESDNELKLTFSGSDLEGLGIDLGDFGGVVSGLSLTATLEKRTGT